MRTYTFFVCGPKFTKFLTANVEGLITYFSDFRYVDLFRVQSRKLLEIAPNFWRFLHSKFCWGTHSNSCTHIMTPASRKFRDVTPTIPEVIGTHMLNFKQIFNVRP